MVLSAKQTRRGSPAKEAAIEEAGREETVRLNAEAPKSLWVRLKRQAAHEGPGRTLAAIVIQACEEYLRKYSDE